MGLNVAPPTITGELRRKGLSDPATIREMEHHAIEKALEWFYFKPFTAEEVLKEDFIKFVHKKMFGTVWKQAGQFRQREQSPGCRWTNIGIQLRQLHADALDRFTNATYPPTEQAVRYMHGLMTICCFEHGNGRHARFMADLMVTKLFGEAPLTWGRLQNTSADDLRSHYTACLEAADCNDYEPLIRFSRS
jgi:Fic-DOC domain mobile mystery protein B